MDSEKDGYALDTAAGRLSGPGMWSEAAVSKTLCKFIQNAPGKSPRKIERFLVAKTNPRMDRSLAINNRFVGL